MIIAIASGKGGTGKTTVATNLATYLAKTSKRTVNLLDCDVEGANSNIFLNTELQISSEVQAARPKWESTKCKNCGQCVDICEFNAIAKVKGQSLIFEELCHSCGACAHLCPEDAYTMIQKTIGRIESGNLNDNFKFGQGELKIGESLSPLVIKKLKETIRPDEITIIDSPPGTTCPVVKSLEDVDYCILVTEPTPFGASDLKLALTLASEMRIRTSVVINRSEDSDSIIEEIATIFDVPIITKIPFSRKYAETYSKGKLLINEHPELKSYFEKILTDIKKSRVPLNNEAPALEQIDNEIKIQPKSQKIENLKEIVVISGKGGTGKTTVTSSFHALSKEMIVSDNDVDAANLHLMIRNTPIVISDFIGGKLYEIDNDKCTSCGLCLQLCAFNGVKFENGVYSINEMNCEGCGLCAKACPTNALITKERKSGQWFKSDTERSAMAHAKLTAGEENSGKLVAKVRDNARDLALQRNRDRILSDGPPGTGCPVISSLTGADLAIIVAEPTLSSIHDMERAINLANHFGVLPRVIINKSTINQDLTNKIIDRVKELKSEVIGTIPFDSNVNRAIKEHRPIVEWNDSPASKAIKQSWKNIKEVLSVF